MWKEIKCPKCNGTGKIIKQISTIINYSYSTGTAKEICCSLCNGYRIIKQKCFGTEKNKIEKRTKYSRFELMDIWDINDNYYKYYDKIESHINSLYNHQIKNLKYSIDKKQEEATQYKVLYDDILVNFKKIMEKNKELEEKIEKLNKFTRFEIMEI